MTEKEYIGQAMMQPVGLIAGRAATVTDFAVIEQSILDILNTPQGSRLLLPEYGSRLHECMFEPNDHVVKALLRQFVKEAIENWEKRCSFADIEFEQENDKINCFISVRILPSNEIQSFVYPFYKQLIH